MKKVEQILTCIKENKIYEAQKILTENFKDNPGSYYYYLGLINLKKENFLSAIVCLKTARRNSINSHLLSYNLSICYINLNRNDLAINELISTIKKEPTFFNAYTNLCNLYIKQKRNKESYRTLKYAQANLKDNKEMLEKLLHIEEKMLQNGFIK